MSPLAQTIRQQVITALALQLAGHAWASAPIQRVHVGRTAFPADGAAPLPLITVLPQPEESAATAYGMEEHTMPVQVVALLRFDPAELPPTGDDNGIIVLTEPVMGELQATACALSDDLAALVERIDYQGGGLADYPDDLGQTVLQVSINLTVIYQTLTGNPYLQDEPEPEP